MSIEGFSYDSNKKEARLTVSKYDFKTKESNKEYVYFNLDENLGELFQEIWWRLDNLEGYDN